MKSAVAVRGRRDRHLEQRVAAEFVARRQYREKRTLLDRNVSRALEQSTLLAERGEFVREALALKIIDRIPYQFEPPSVVDLRLERGDRQADVVQTGVGIERHQELKYRVPAPRRQQPPAQIAFGLRHSPAQAPRSGTGR